MRARAASARLGRRGAVGRARSSTFGSCVPFLRPMSARRRAPPPPAPCAHGKPLRAPLGAAAAETPVLDSVELSGSYNSLMSERMGWDADPYIAEPYEYHFDAGLYYHEISPDLLCGTQPRDTEELDYLREVEGVTAILNLQQAEDTEYWGINIRDHVEHAKRTNLKYIRRPVADFNEDSLRMELPRAVKALAQARQAQERVYVHCTAGLGRAPATIIAYLYWFSDDPTLQGLQEAYDHLTAKRKCGPKKNAIRHATYDLISDYAGGFAQLPSHAFLHMAPSERLTLRNRIYEWFD